MRMHSRDIHSPLPRRVGALVASMRDDGFPRTVAVLAGGTATAQAINVLMAPVITRLFSPTDVGRLGLYLVFIDVVSVGLVLRLETALVSARTDRETAQLAVLAFGILPIAAVAASVVFFLLIRMAIGGYDAIPASTAPWMVVSLILTGAGSTFRYWLVRADRFRPISHALVLQNGGRAGAQLMFALANVGWLGLLAGDLIGRGAGLLVMARDAGRSIVDSAGPLRTLPARALFRHYWRFPVLSLPSSFLDALALALPIPLITSLYGIEAAGLFVLVQMVLALPTAVIGTSVADAFHGRIAHLVREAPKLAIDLFWRTGIALVLIGTPIAVAAMTLGPFVVDLVFGAAWHAAGPLLVVTAPWALSSLIVGPLSRVVFVYQGQALKVGYDVLTLALVYLSLTLAASSGLDLVAAVALLSLVRVVAYAAYLLLLIRLMRAARRMQTETGQRPEPPGFTA